MRRESAARSPGRVLVSGGLLLLLVLPLTAWADVPWLSIRLAGGGQACFPVSELARVECQGDTLIVVWAGGSESWGTDTITRIEFLWDPATSAGPHDAAALLKAVNLFQNQPNPFSPETRIAFDLPSAGRVELTIHGPDGRLIRQLLSEQRGAGRHTAIWDGRSDAGKKVAGGIYFYQLRAPRVEESRRMILLP